MQAIDSPHDTYNAIPSTPFERALLARLEALEADNKAKDERIAELGSQQNERTTALERQLTAAVEEITTLKSRSVDVGAKIVGLEMAQEEYEDHLAQIAKRLLTTTAPPSPPPQKTTEKTEGHFAHVKALLLKAENHRLTVKFLALRLKVTKQQAWNIIHRMESEGMVNVIWDPHHKQRRLVELRQVIGTRSEM